MAGRPKRVEIYARLDEAFVELRERLGGLPDPTEADDIWTTIWYEEAHNSTALEGNTLVLRQVETLLAEGRAVGNKELREYMEVKGYADAAKWVYGQALKPRQSDGSLLMLTEVRWIHQAALGPVWEVAPHPYATPKEAPGSFREHDVAEFPGGMRPPSWTEVAGAMRDWVRHAGARQGRRVALRGDRRPARSVRADPSIPRRQRPYGTPARQSPAGPPRLRPGDRVQAR